MDSQAKRRLAVLRTALNGETDMHKIEQIKREIAIAEATVRLYSKIEPSQS